MHSEHDAGRTSLIINCYSSSSLHTARVGTEKDTDEIAKKCLCQFSNSVGNETISGSLPRHLTFRFEHYAWCCLRFGTPHTSVGSFIKETISLIRGALSPHL